VDPTPRSRWRAILGDVHFWIPVAVLALGLVALWWIA
jgi:hypothetical protein